MTANKEKVILYQVPISNPNATPTTKTVLVESSEIPDTRQWLAMERAFGKYVDKTYFLVRSVVVNDKKRPTIKPEVMSNKKKKVAP